MSKNMHGKSDDTDAICWHSKFMSNINGQPGNKISPKLITAFCLRNTQCQWEKKSKNDVHFCFVILDLGQCPEPGGVAYSTRSGALFPYHIGDTVDYTCDRDYFGGGTRVCQQDGIWSDKISYAGGWSLFVTVVLIQMEFRSNSWHNTWKVFDVWREINWFVFRRPRGHEIAKKSCAL